MSPAGSLTRPWQGSRSKYDPRERLTRYEDENDDDDDLLIDSGHLPAVNRLVNIAQTETMCVSYLCAHVLSTAPRAPHCHFIFDELPLFTRAVGHGIVCALIHSQHGDGVSFGQGHRPACSECISASSGIRQLYLLVLISLTPRPHKVHTHTLPPVLMTTMTTLHH